MMEEASPPETSVNFFQTLRHNTSEGSRFHTRRYDNLKSEKWLFNLSTFTQF
jgi:hypothetical protein